MSEYRETLSIVVPAYNEQDNIRRAAKEILAVMDENAIFAAVYFVDDGSTDDSWAEICRLSEEEPRVRGVHFSRNFGKESAIFAGLETAAGDCVAVMDCDLQHPPKTLAEMYRLWENGFEVIEGVKKSRGNESALYKKMSELFYSMMSAATKGDMSRASDFKLLDRKAVDAVLSLPERDTFFRALSTWVGYKTASVEFDVQERMAGESKWSKLGLIRYAINNVTSFTTKPLTIVLLLGSLFFVLALILGVECLVTYLRHRALEGFTTVILIELIVGAIVMISLGIIGIYVAKIYEEVKARPRYIIASTVGLVSRREHHDAV